MHFGFTIDSSDIYLWDINLLDTDLDLLDTDIPSKRLEDVLLVSKTSSRRFENMSSRHLQDVLEDEKLLRWCRRVEDVFKTCLEDQ